MLFFGRKNKTQDVGSTSAEQLAKRSVAPGTQIHYDAELIDRFKRHHGALVELITKVTTQVQTSRFDEAEKNFNKFRTLLNEHLLEENLRLYTYLSYCLKGDPEGSELMHDMRQEMAGLGRKVTHFIKHYQEFGINADNATVFLRDLAHVTEVLSDRIDREERSLYTMYMPPEAIQTG